jgi:hypothetical protein
LLAGDDGATDQGADAKAEQNAAGADPAAAAAIIIAMSAIISAIVIAAAAAIVIVIAAIVVMIILGVGGERGGGHRARGKSREGEFWKFDGHDVHPFRKKRFVATYQICGPDVFIAASNRPD